MAGKTFNPAEMDSTHLEKMTARKDNQKLSLKSKKPWKKRDWRLAAQGRLEIESQQVTFRETALKDENYQKQGKNQSLKWLTVALVPMEPRGEN